VALSLLLVNELTVVLACAITHVTTSGWAGPTVVLTDTNCDEWDVVVDLLKYFLLVAAC